MAATLRLHAFLPRSRANGPGERAVVWVQGCSLGCVGCFNPQTHDVPGGEVIGVRELAEQIIALSADLEGLTISGGEPLQQLGAVAELLRMIRSRTKLPVILFSGYTWSEIQALEGAAAVLSEVDTLIAGRYDSRARVQRSLLGSSNQTIHCLTFRYALSDFAAVPEAEVVISSDGKIVVTGIMPQLASVRRHDRGA